jgi:hypothetical protein
MPAGVTMSKRSIPPAHRGSRCRLVDLIGKGLSGFSEAGTQAVFCETIDEQAQHHDEAQSHNPLRFLHKDGRSQEQGIFEETKATFDTALLLVMLMSSSSESWQASKMLFPTMKQARRRSSSVIRSCLSESVAWHCQRCMGTASLPGRPLPS